MKKRIIAIKISIFFIFSIITIRLFVLQIWNYEFYKKAMIKNTSLIIKQSALRAEIKDRNGLIIAQSEPVFSIKFIANKSELLRIQIILKKENYQSKIEYNTLTIDELSWQDLSKIFAINHIPRPEIYIKQKRKYLATKEIAHITGYTKTENNNIFGLNGIEKYFHDCLKGQDGFKSFLVNAKQKKIKEKNSTDPLESASLNLSIDLKLQNFAYKKISKYKQAAIIIVNIETGEILCATSHPSFDPNDFVNKNNAKIKEYYKSEIPVLINLLNSPIPPASTFKPFILLAALENNAQKTYQCDGIFYLNKHPIRCWKKHGEIDIEEILPQSCNCAFYSLAEILNEQKLKKYFTIFGFNEPILKELNWNYYKFPQKKHLTKFDIMLMNIGQGFAITLMQLTQAYARLIANKKVQLTILKSEDIKHFEPLNFNPEHINLIKKSLFNTINKNKGTVFGINKEINAGGKTGTGQVTNRKSDKSIRKNRDHALFCAFAPNDNPKIVGCIILMHEGYGKKAAPILLDIFKEFQFT